MSARPPPVPDGCPLTRHEFECARLLTAGLTYKQIAARRGRSPSTIRTLLHTAYRRLEVSNGAQAVAVISASGWCDQIDTAWEDERLTAAQSLYVAAFERWLRDRTELNADERAFWLRGVYHEAHVIPPWEVLGTPRRWAT